MENKKIEDIEKLSDKIKDFITENGFVILDSYDFLTKLEELLREQIDKNYD